MKAPVRKKLLLGSLALVILFVVGVSGYGLLERWLRPDINRLGGTILAYAVDEDRAPERYNLWDVVAALQRRLDPSGRQGIEVRATGDRLVEIAVPRVGDHAARLEQIKKLVVPQGSLEFRILANEEDDPKALSAARRWLRNPRNAGALDALARRNEPPPPPRNAYAWAELGPAEVKGLGLDPEGLKEAPDVRRRVERACRMREPFTLPSRLAGCLLFARPRGEGLQFFVLTRLAEEGKEITGAHLTRVRRAGTGLDFTLDSKGMELACELTSRNSPTGEGDTAFLRRLAVLLDGRVVSAPVIRGPVRAKGRLTGHFSDAELDRLLALLRGGSLPAPLKPKPVSVVTVEPK
jgi:hypothetical protein